MHDDDDHSASSRDEPGEPGEPGEAVTGDLWDLRDVRDLRDLRDQGAGFGNKAAGLARLIAAGLPVPPGFAIAARVFEQIAGPLELRDLDVAGRVLDAAARRIEQAEPSTELATELRTSLRELGSVVIVRSSSPLEDGARGGGAGVFESSGPIPAELDRVWHAIRAVWTSALAPVAIAYARGRTQALRLGVIVQHHVAGERVTVYTRAPSGSSDELVIQRGDTLVRVPRARLPERLADHHAAIQALRAERVVGGPVDVELVQQRTPEQVSTQVSTQVPTQVFETWIVQARPIVIAPRRAALTPPPPIVLAPLQDGRVWTWDVTHNPDPLSPAQLALVERVERARLGAYELRAVAGYLYTSPRDPARPTFQGELSAALIARCRELEATADHLLAAASPHRELARAVAAYAAFYALWADELSPRIAELRRRGHAGPGASPAHHRPSSVEAAITACALGAIDLAELVRRIGAVSPAWDVAVATFGERPELLHQAVALAVVAERAERAERADAPRTRGELSTADRARPHELVDLATADRARPHELDDLATADRARPHELVDLATADRARPHELDDLAAIAADLAERDDLLFARAQQLVRNALCARGYELGIAEDVFWLDPEVIEADPELGDPAPSARVDAPPGSLPTAPFDRVLAKRKAAAARAAHARAAGWQMPLVVGPGEPRDQACRKPLQGVGFGPPITGRVVRFASLASAVLASPGDVIVVRAVTPALAVFVGRCAALVSETGNLLDHGAALARELGITCVVGCRDAWASLHDDDVVDVDGDAGTVSPR